MDLVMRVCDRITVLDFGKVIADGTPAEVRDDPAVLAAYLGDEVDARRAAPAAGPAARRATLRCSRCATWSPRTARSRRSTASACRVPAGKDHRGARRERRRQDDAAAHRLRAGARPKAGSVPLDGEDITRAPVEEMVRRAWRTCPRAAASSPS